MSQPGRGNRSPRGKSRRSTCPELSVISLRTLQRQSVVSSSKKTGGIPMKSSSNSQRGITVSSMTSVHSNRVSVQEPCKSPFCGLIQNRTIIKCSTRVINQKNKLKYDNVSLMYFSYYASINKTEPFIHDIPPLGTRHPLPRGESGGVGGD